MLARLAVLSLLSLCAGCVGSPSKCYVTVSAVGQPTAEACETGPQLVVRPITPTSAAYYVPPYVLGALSYEGYIDLPPAAEDPAKPPVPEAGAGVDGAASALSETFAEGKTEEPAADPDGFGTSGPAPASGRSPVALPLQLEESDPGPDLSRYWDAPLLANPFAALQTEAGLRPPPSNRIAPKPTIDGEVRYWRPYSGYQTPALSSDLLL
ncbi:hypothetical protein [Jiella sp. M17.18]|uniref:hypothetical protein n=1 Tax=Jiella sp. M17.18 TaxID=3234247 RepID=UPI0034DEC3E8